MNKNVYFPHRPGSIGGPSSFQKRLEFKLIQNGYKVFYANDSNNVVSNFSSVVIVVGGTKKIFWLIKCKINGFKIIHRLDGIHDYQFNFKDGVKSFVKSRLIHFMINFIRRFLADHVVYQSNYVKNIWEIYGGKLKNTSVIYNAVNLNEFFPVEKNAKSSEFSIVAVEGTVQGELALRALKSMTSIKINVYGRVHKMIKNALQISNNKNVILHGSIPREDIPKIFVGKKIYLCLEINPACPNSVIEALAAGVPVVGFNSGSLLELVGDAGVILPLENAGFKNFKDDDFKALNLAIEKIVGDYDYYSTLARTRSEKFYNLDDQFLKYKDLF